MTRTLKIFKIAVKLLKNFVPSARFPKPKLYLLHCWQFHLETVLFLYPINVWFHAKDQYLRLKIGQKKQKFGQEKVRNLAFEKSADTLPSGFRELQRKKLLATVPQVTKSIGLISDTTMLLFVFSEAD